MLPSLSLSGFLSRPLSQGTACFRNKIGGLAWYPGVAIARPTVLSHFATIEFGTLEIIDEPRGERLLFGSTDNPPMNSPAPPHAVLIITSPTFYLRLFLLADMGFAASYLLHEVRSPDLTAFFRLFILNRARLGSGATWWASSLLTGALSRAGPAITNTGTNALLNAAAHYDLGNDMFAAFLSSDMTYSCPIWATHPTKKLREEETWEEGLEAAQMRKLRRVVDAARIRTGDHVLEIGTGWGSFAVEAVKRTGCRVTTVTLSREQKAWAEEKVRLEGLQKSIEVLLADYREVPEVKGGYDKIVSIEMLEAVGKEFLATYFAQVQRLLKREGGVAVFQCIIMPEGRQRAYEARGE
jgi:cyclopropane-fatty-acyl-phospholipid synthase